MMLLTNRMPCKVFMFFFVIFLIACEKTDHSILNLGQPTLLQGSTPVETLCSIQQEFNDLPKPILKDIVYHQEDSRWMQVEFHFTKEHLPDYYQFMLTDSAQAWTRTHTHAEISAALMPLVIDLELGGEAAILLTSLASNHYFRSKEYGRHTSSIASHISKFMFDSGYRSLSNAGLWGVEMAHSFGVPHELRLAYSFPNEERTMTLNKYLRRLHSEMSYYENGLMLSYDSDHFNHVATLDEWSKKNPLPPMPEPKEHAALIETYGKSFTILGGYSAGLPKGIVVYELGITRYWPLNYSQAHTIKETAGDLAKSSEYRNLYYREMKERVNEFSREICGVGI